MPIDYSIPLQVRGANVGQAVVAGRQAKQQNQLFDMAVQDRAINQSRAAAQEARAVAQEGRAAQSHATDQGLLALRTLNAAAAEIQTNPQAASRWIPQLRAVGVPEEVLSQPLDQESAKQLFESTSKALQAYQAGSLVNQAKPSADIEQYREHVRQAQAAGAEPLPYLDPNSPMDFVRFKAQSSVGAQFGAPTDVPGVGVVQPSRTQGPAGNVVISPESSVAAAEAERAGQEATVRADVAATAEQQKELIANQRTLEVWGVAKQGLISALAGTETGPVAGRIPAVTSGQQIAEGAVAAVAPVLKQLFRSSGEGVFTDRDQQLLLDMVPKRTDHPETAAAKIEMIDAIIQAKLSASIPGDTPTNGVQQVGRFQVEEVQ